MDRLPNSHEFAHHVHAKHRLQTPLSNSHVGGCRKICLLVRIVQDIEILLILWLKNYYFTLPRPFAYLFAMNIPQSSTDVYNPSALPQKPPPPTRPAIKSTPHSAPSKEPPHILVDGCWVLAPPPQSSTDVYNPSAKKAPPPLLPVVKSPPPIAPSKQPPPIPLDSSQMQAPPAKVKKPPPPRSNHKPKSPSNVTPKDENAQLAHPLRVIPHKVPAQQKAPSLKSLPREAPALKAPPPKLSSETNVKTSN